MCTTSARTGRCPPTSTETSATASVLSQELRFSRSSPSLPATVTPPGYAWIVAQISNAWITPSLLGSQHFTAALMQFAFTDPTSYMQVGGT
mmetsp:Transcript_14290/g.43030  ORF Transcript_14290/g.43030 Transcript_14290/m.43030 type:complete len:91 (+) Transcript_14290:552-824(+)